MTVAELATMALREGAVQKHGELEAFLRLVCDRRPRAVVEIGTLYGGTLAAWCQAADRDALIVSVDLRGVHDARRLEGHAQPGQRLRLIRGDSHAAWTYFNVHRALAGEPVDLLFVDGDHSYEGASLDYRDYSPLVRSGGLVAFHDIVPHPEVPECEVDRVWADVKPLHLESYEFVVEGDERGWGPWGGIGCVVA